MSSNVSFERLDSRSVTGAIAISVAAVIAMFSVLLVLLHILLVLIIPAYRSRMSSHQERNFITSPLGLYITFLFVSNFISSVAGVMEVGWASTQHIRQGPSCTTQAFLAQLGGNAAALWLGLISMSALSTFMFRAPSLPKLVAVLMIVLLWTAMIIFDGTASSIFAGHSKQFFYGIAGVWCWITPSHRMARLFTQYVWMWSWSLVSAMCFLFVFLCVRGNIEVKKGANGRTIRWTKSTSGLWRKRTEEYEGLVGTVGKTMCWFPISYIILTLPMSVSRIAETFGFPVPTYAFVFSAINFLLIGVMNSIIYIALRHALQHASVPDSPEATLRGSFGDDKFGIESFEVPQEKCPSPVNDKPNSYPWTPTPTTKEWVPPSPHHGLRDPTSPPSPVVAYAMTRDDDITRSSIVSDAPPRQVPVSSKMAQRTRSFHRPMESISTVTSMSTTMEPSVPLATVTEVSESPVEAVRPQLTMPPAALLARQQSSPSPNILSPQELNNLAYVLLSPEQRQGHKRTETQESMYTGPRAISPDLNALLEASQPSSVPSGPLPPPRKNKRCPTPSVPVDVDETDQGSFSVSPQASNEEFDREDIRPMSIGDMTTRTPVKRADSLRSFWAAYQGSSPATSNMPPSHARDTMRTFWAAYEDPSSPDIPAEFASARRETGLESKDWKPSARSSEDSQRVDASVFLKPAISAVASAAPSRDGSAAPSRNGSASSGTISTRSTATFGHRRSSSFSPMPTAPMPTMLRPATSAVARYGSPGLAIRKGPVFKHTPTPSNSSYTSDASYRTPRPQPGYL